MIEIETLYLPQVVQQLAKTSSAEMVSTSGELPSVWYLPQMHSPFFLQYLYVFTCKVAINMHIFGLQYFRIVILQNHLIQMVTDVYVLPVAVATIFYIDYFPGHKERTIYGKHAYTIYFRTLLVD